MKTNEKLMNTVEKSMKRSNYFGYAPTNSVAQTNLCEDYCGFTGFGRRGLGPPQELQEGSTKGLFCGKTSKKGDFCGKSSMKGYFCGKFIFITGS